MFYLVKDTKHILYQLTDFCCIILYLRKTTFTQHYLHTHSQDFSWGGLIDWLCEVILQQGVKIWTCNRNPNFSSHSSTKISTLIILLGFQEGRVQPPWTHSLQAWFGQVSLVWNCFVWYLIFALYLIPIQWIILYIIKTNLKACDLIQRSHRISVVR